MGAISGSNAPAWEPIAGIPLQIPFPPAGVQFAQPRATPWVAVAKHDHLPAQRPNPSLTGWPVGPFAFPQQRPLVAHISAVPKTPWKLSLLLLFRSPGVYACGRKAIHHFSFPTSPLQGAMRFTFDPFITARYP
jgi:hypothetical protein